jgi:hypothetical protein
LPASTVSVKFEAALRKIVQQQVKLVQKNREFFNPDFGRLWIAKSV